MSPSLTVSVVVMAFNEVANLQDVVIQINGALALLPGGPARDDEILIVDDGSTDGTRAVADALADAIAGVRVVHHPMNRGLGGVYRTGFENANQDLIMFFPADGQFPAAIISGFYPLMPDHDLVLGYVSQRSRSLLAKGLSFAEKALYRILFGPMPKYQGVFMVRRAVLSAVPLETTGRGWGIVMEMIIRICRGGYRVKSVPTALTPRTSGRSKVNTLGSIWINLKQTIALRYRMLRQ